MSLITGILIADGMHAREGRPAFFVYTPIMPDKCDIKIYIIVESVHNMGVYSGMTDRMSPGDTIGYTTPGQTL
jgi:hypothetical protein